MSEGGDEPRRRRRPAPPTAQPTQGSVARGVVLVAVAVVVGLLLLRDDDAGRTQVAVGSDSAGASDGPGESDGEDDANDDGATTTTTAPLREPSEVKVLVANGSGINGAAGRATESLEALGYVTGTPADAERVPATVVYFTEGYEREAEALAEAIGAPPTSATSMPAVAPVDDLQLANVLVVLGPDLATG